MGFIFFIDPQIHFRFQKIEIVFSDSLSELINIYCFVISEIHVYIHTSLFSSGLTCIIENSHQTNIQIKEICDVKLEKE
jgi:hypothetical protein